MRSVSFILVFSLSLIGCVSSGKFHAMVRQAHLSDSLYAQSMRTLKSCQDDNNRLAKEKSALTEQNRDMTQQVTAANEVNGQLRKQMAQLAAVSSAQAESIKRSLDNMGARDSYMIALHSAMTSRDSANMAVLIYLKQAIGGYGEQNVRIQMEKGAVQVDLSDSLLYNGDTAGYDVSDKATPVLSRLARALNNLTDVGIVVEGSANNPAARVDSLTTRVDSAAAPRDSLATRMDSMLATRTDSMLTTRMDSMLATRMDSGLTTRVDSTANWDLALKRAAAIVRILQDHHVLPVRMTAAGTTTLPADHPIRIHFLPKAEQLLQLLEQGQRNPSPPAPAVSGS